MKQNNDIHTPVSRLQDVTGDGLGCWRTRRGLCWYIFTQIMHYSATWPDQLPSARSWLLTREGCAVSLRGTASY